MPEADATAMPELAPAPIMPSAVERLHARLAERLGCPRLLVTVPPAAPNEPLLLLETQRLVEALRTVSLDPPPETLLVVRPQGHDGAGRVALMHIHPGAGAPLAGLVSLVTRTLEITGRCRTAPDPRPGLRQSLALEMAVDGRWETVGHCGTPAPETRRAAGLDPDAGAIDLLEIDVYAVQVAGRLGRY
ncbi:hypothetical protein [Sediminicurvatus halobius]|uniref:Uncharacterized protein n=1 Tax=Sediminicurvatus halobius TaxID=2182432 RepID=A0A2U2N8H2_9GAMM|nr:hypothetical protein [Spiribacter halobius]PWG65491.1 hypothetical protein DEM34_01755 [Spiribacter halobius]UEX76515.1 hypothetical protein LMH63_11130 [Spiribacter halobius]